MMRRNLEADLGHRRAEGRGQRVRGRDARDADDDGADEADRAGAQALLRETAGVFAGRGASGASAPWGALIACLFLS